MFVFDTDQSTLNPFNGKRFKDEPMLLISGTRLMFSNCDNGWLVRQRQTEQIHRDLRKDFYLFLFFYLTTHSTHFIYGYMASDIWLRTILIVRKETRCRHIGYSYRLTARVLLYAPSHRQDNTYHGICYTSRGALAGTRNS